MHSCCDLSRLDMIFAMIVARLGGDDERAMHCCDLYRLDMIFAMIVARLGGDDLLAVGCCTVGARRLLR